MKRIITFLGIFILTLFLSGVFVQAQTEVLTSQEYVRKAWEASSQNNFEEVERLTNECVLYYSEEAKKQQRKNQPWGRLD